MKQETLVEVIPYFTLIFMVGVLVGALISPQKTEILSERKTACEEKGGKYYYIWSKISNDYLEICERTNNEIEDF